MRLLIITIVIVVFFAGYIAGEEGIIAMADYDRQFEVIEIEVTAYSPSRAQTDSNPFETASQRIVKPSELERVEIVAISRRSKRTAKIAGI